MSKPELPLVYNFQSWHAIPLEWSAYVPGLLDAVMKANDGQVPAELDTEPILVAWSNAAKIPVTYADVEDALIWPHRYYARRDWVKEQYRHFVAWCQGVGYLESTSVEETVSDEPPVPEVEGQNEQTDGQANYPPVEPPSPPATPDEQDQSGKKRRGRQRSASGSFG